MGKQLAKRQEVAKAAAEKAAKLAAQLKQAAPAIQSRQEMAMAKKISPVRGGSNHAGRKAVKWGLFSPISVFKTII